MATRKKSETGSAADGSRSRVPSTSDSAPSATQLAALEQGIRLFREHRFQEARDYFDKATKGPSAAMSLSAKNHILVCERRIQRPSLDLRTAEDHYNYAVERLNARDLENARKHFEVALALRPTAEHILYGFATTLALSGDVAGAYENLRRAIEIEPRNRMAARQDPDFAAVSHHPLFAQLFHPEKAH